MPLFFILEAVAIEQLKISAIPANPLSCRFSFSLTIAISCFGELSSSSYNTSSASAILALQFKSCSITNLTISFFLLIALLFFCKITLSTNDKEVSLKRLNKKDSSINKYIKMTKPNNAIPTLLGSFRWKCGESNSGPHKETIRFLHAYLSLHFRDAARPEPPTASLSSKISPDCRGST